MMETITLNSKEQVRAIVVQQVLGGELTVGEGAATLGISPRQMQRLKAAVRKEGPAGLVHGNRGRQPHHALGAAVRQQVEALLAGVYAGINDVQVSELLAEVDGIVVSRSTVRRLRIAAGRATVRPRRPPRHRRRRARKNQAGMLVQIDGSRHPWLGPAGPWLTLLAGIDDATGEVVAAQFREAEDSAGYLTLLHQLVSSHGRPQAVYHDRHGIFLRSGKEPWTVQEELAGVREPTQVGRALQQFGIASVVAHSPQAKGRIERLFGTLQDRLVATLRLAGIQDLSGANALLASFLPRFNAQFRVEPADPTPAWRPLAPGMDPWQICCLGYQRVVAHDDTIAFAGVHLQLAPRQQRSTWARATVEVREHLDGSLSVWHGPVCITSAAAPPDAPTLRARGGPRPRVVPVAAPPPEPHLPDGEVVLAVPPVPSRPQRQPPRKPKPDHPWRRPFKPRG